MKILEVGENIKICGLDYIVYDALYCESYKGSNSTCFEVIGVNKEKFTTNILGYYRAGAFPYCSSLEDLTKLVNALNEEYDRQQNKSMFITGKWYKGEPNNYYIKYLSTELQSSYNEIWFTESIVHCKHDYIKDYWAADDLEQFALKNPVDLSEIQQYLPDGHPDKFTTSITKGFILPEKWCVKARNKEEDDILIRWRGGKHSDKIGESYMLSIKYWTRNKDEYTEITFEQFKQYVLKEYVDSKEVNQYSKPFEFNKWYKLGNILEYFSSEDLYYGFDRNGNWFSGGRIEDDYTNDYLQINQSRFIPASNEEVEERLLEYAKKQYPIGTKLKECLQGWIIDNEIGIIESKPYWDSIGIWAMGSVYGLCIYLNGKWAEIESKIIQKEQLDINDISIGTTEWMDKGKIESTLVEYTAKCRRKTKPQEFDPYSPIVELE